MDTADKPRFSLKELPPPAKLVVSTFLISVGIGYLWALAQLHFQHGSGGTAMPTLNDTVEHFSGVADYWGGGHDGETEAASKPEPVSKIEMLLTASADKPFNSNGQMVTAFLGKQGGFEKLADDIGEGEARAERRGELDAMLEWVRADPAVRKKAYEEDKFKLPDPLVERELMTPYVDEETVSVLAIRSLIKDRCVKCHADGGSATGDFTSYAGMAPYLEVPKMDEETGMMMDSGKQISKEALAQSTHAHMLSFSMLFGLTGLVFVFTTYPTWARLTLGPFVLIMQVIDISCWWLARLEYPHGPMFATAIVFTGGAVGMGLCAQIVLSLFNMYGRSGKLVLVAMFVAAGVGLGVLKQQVIDPQLAAEKAAGESAALSQPE